MTSETPSTNIKVVQTGEPKDLDDMRKRISSRLETAMNEVSILQTCRVIHPDKLREKFNI